jgi:hypothetical protein
VAGFDLARYTGALVVVAGGLVAFALVHFALQFALGADAAALLDDQPIGWDKYKKVWSRVAAIDQFDQRGQLPADTRLGVVIGGSSAQAGFHPEILNAKASIANRWLVLSGTGMSFKNMESVTRPLFFCGLQPTVAVLCVHPQMLAGERYLPGEAPRDSEQVVGRRKLSAGVWKTWVKRTLSAHWAVKNHVVVAHFLRSWVYQGRLSVFEEAGLRAAMLFEPSDEPWKDEPVLWDLGPNEVFAQEFAQNQLDDWRTRGHFEAASYDPDGAQARCFVRMVEGLRKHGTKVYVVVMPERSPLRGLVPAQAKPRLWEVLRRAFPGREPPVFDAQEALPDRYFVDEGHLTRVGAARLTKLVADYLEQNPGIADGD